MGNQEKERHYVRYNEGAKMYGVCRNTFIKMANEANAVSKVDRICFVDLRILEHYLSCYRK